jgi:hypothetical protein
VRRLVPYPAVYAAGEEFKVGTAGVGDHDELTVENDVAEDGQRSELGDPWAHVVAASRPQPDPAGGHLGDTAEPVHLHLVRPTLLAGWCLGGGEQHRLIRGRHRHASVPHGVPQLSVTAVSLVADDPLPPRMLMRALSAASASPISLPVQPWIVRVVTICGVLAHEEAVATQQSCSQTQEMATIGASASPVRPIVSAASPSQPAWLRL